MHCTFCRSKNVQNKGESNLLTLPFTKSTENVGFVRLNKYIKCWELLVNNAFGQLEIAVFWSIQTVISALTKNWNNIFGQHTLDFTKQALNVHV